MKPALPVLLLLVTLSLAGCHSDHVAVDRKDPKTPQFSYRLDELALLQMAADDIQDQERDKRYGKIYDDFAAPEFKAQTSRRRFLIWGNCAETYLGGLDEYDRNELGFFRENAKSKTPIDSLVRTVHRTRFVVKERMGFVYDGIHFKLRNWTWITNDKAFHECMADSPRLESSNKPIEASSDEAEKRKTLESQQTAPSASNTVRSNRVEPEPTSRVEPTSTDKQNENERSSDSAVTPGKSDGSASPNTQGKEKESGKETPVNNTPPTPGAAVAPTSLHYARSHWRRPTVVAPGSAVPSQAPKHSVPAPEKKISHNSPPVPGQD